MVNDYKWRLGQLSTDELNTTTRIASMADTRREHRDVSIHPGYWDYQYYIVI